jgi:preprotein translocase subunit SecG
MLQVILAIHLMVAIALVAVVLLQRSEGGALGIGGSGGGFLSGRSAANLLTRTTAILAAAFFVTSLALAKLAEHDRTPKSILDQQTPPPHSEQAPPAQEPSAPIAR